MVPDPSGGGDGDVHGAGPVAGLAVDAGIGIAPDAEDAEEVEQSEYRPVGTGVLAERALDEKGQEHDRRQGDDVHDGHGALEHEQAEQCGDPPARGFLSGTRKEELLTDPDELQKLWVLRKVLHPMDELAAIEFLLNKLQDTKTNAQFFEAMKR